MAESYSVWTCIFHELRSYTFLTQLLRCLGLFQAFEAGLLRFADRCAHKDSFDCFIIGLYLVLLIAPDYHGEAVNRAVVN